MWAVEFAEIVALRRHNPAWKLLRADHAPLILSFLGKVFVSDNARSMSRADLISRLDDELYALNQQHDDTHQVPYPKPAKEYLDDWAAAGNGWLRKYYPPGDDEPHYDITPSVERALSWLKSLEQRSFVGTESRLNTLFELLRQMAYGAEIDPQVRLDELHRRRDEIDTEIAEVERGNVATLDDTAQRDRYQQFTSTARELLADFREVEHNFRKLDRELRETIATWDGGKGTLLDDVLGYRDAIAESDQGKSFQAFYDFLLSQQRQREFSELLGQVQRIQAIDNPDPRMRRIHHDWLAACERTQQTVRRLSDQLRRFLDDQAWLENRRAMDLLRSIEATALKVRDHGLPPLTFDIEGTSPTVVLPMERPLYSPSATTTIDSAIEVGVDDIDSSALFEQVFVDRARLSATVRKALQTAGQVRLADVVDDHPLEQGLAELVAYLSLSDDGFDVIFDEQSRDQVRWDDDDGTTRVATVPRVTFVRETR
jgi:hypothetical protein